VCCGSVDRLLPRPEVINLIVDNVADADIGVSIRVYAISSYVVVVVVVAATVARLCEIFINVRVGVVAIFICCVVEVCFELCFDGAEFVTMIVIATYGREGAR
jgi:F0F1-type ATP synthase assembly protein I